MSGTSIWIMIIGVSVVSILPRVLPVALFSRYEFPELLKRWLSHVAPSVLGGLTALSVLAPDGTIDISVYSRHIWAFVPMLLVPLRPEPFLQPVVWHCSHGSAV